MSARSATPEPPRFAALHRTPGGLPVPHVAAWSSEATTEVRIDESCALLGSRQPAAHSGGRQGEGRALLGEMEPARQRRAMIHRRCQVCDLSLERVPRPRNPRLSKELWLADLRVTGTDDAGSVSTDAHGRQTVTFGGRDLPLILEPWTCPDCLAYALAVCPGLVKTAGSHLGLDLLRVREAACVAVTGRILGGGPVAGRLAITYVKVVPIRFDVVTPDQFLEEYTP